MRRFLFILTGGFVGFVLGAVLGVVGFYLIFMLPRHQPFAYIDQGTLITVFTAPIGALVGALLGGLFGKRTTLKPV